MLTVALAITVMAGLTYKQLLKLIERVALNHPNISSVFFNEYNFTSISNIQYPALVVLNTSSDLTATVNTHNFTFIWADRLTKDGNNWIDVQSEGYSTVPEVINALDRYIGMSDVEDLTVNSFKDQHADLLAGVAVDVSLQTVSELGNCDYLCCDVDLDCK